MTSSLIQELQLEKHPAGGYWREIDRQETQIPSPFAPKLSFDSRDNRTDNPPRPLVTSIYHLLTKDSPSAVFIKNRSVAYHIHHQGKAEYTTITPIPGHPPRIEKKILGPDTAAGESRFLTFGSEVWKMARLPPGSEECLLSLVVVPGFHWEDHEFLTKEGLEELLAGVEGGEENIADFGKYLK
ncbi:hypothetical protein VNI00_012192 [Paramarasmius palmivorus]|uniref:DUF985 domain-containing protein n=1 Tax=Paramarasmius palmivorus TaxID=297713 RepID=A0AAW0C7J0_9AGAR